MQVLKLGMQNFLQGWVPRIQTFLADLKHWSLYAFVARESVISFKQLAKPLLIYSQTELFILFLYSTTDMRIQNT